MRVLYCLLLLSFCLPASAQDFEPAIKQIQDRIKQRPDDPTLYYFLSSFQARAKRLEEATASMAKAAELGDGLLPVQDFGFENLKDHAPFQELRDKMVRDLPRVTAASLAFRIPDKTFIPEGIAFDPTDGSFLWEALPKKRIVRVARNGKMVPFSKAGDGLHEILGIAIDQRRRVLYAVSTSAVSPNEKPHNSVVRYDLASRRKTAEFVVPEAGQLNDIAIHPDGHLFVTDSALGQVFRIDAQTGKHQLWIARGTLGGTNGLALSADGAILYIAHSTGLARADVASAKVERMPAPARQSLAAIDGLYFADGALIGIQNVTNPGRVIRIALNPAHEVTSVDTLLSHHHPDIEQPTTGALANGAFYLLATTQVGRYAGPGQLRERATLRPPSVLRIALPQ